MRHDALGEINEFLVLDFLREQLEATRAEIAEALALSPATISRIVGRLLERGLVSEGPAAATAGPGRPSTVLKLVLDRIAVVGIDLGGTKCHGAFSSIDGVVLDEQVVTVADAGGAFSALETVWRTLAEKAAERDIAIGSLAVGVPAVIDPDTRLATRGPNVGWDGFDLLSGIEAFGVPFVVDNDVNLAAIAEGEVGQAVGVRDYLLLSIGTGLGAAIVSNGSLVRGRHNAAGEIGVMLPESAMLPQPRTAQVGGLESVLSGAAIARRAAERVAGDGAAREELGEAPTAKDVIEAALAGRPHARSLIDGVLHALAVAVINTSSVTDPEIVILDGSVGRALAPFFDEVDALVRNHVLTPPRLTASAIGPNSTVRGAISAAIQHLRRLDAPSSLTPLNSEGDRR